MATAEEREKALERIRQFKLKLPTDYKFDRDEANSRGKGHSFHVRFRISDIQSAPA
jgi:hypothetical protein